MGEGMEEVWGEGGPWTVAGDPQQEGGDVWGGLVMSRRIQMDRWEDRGGG